MMEAEDVRQGAVGLRQAPHRMQHGRPAGARTARGGGPRPAQAAAWADQFALGGRVPALAVAFDCGGGQLRRQGVHRACGVRRPRGRGAGGVRMPGVPRVLKGLNLGHD
ncbi:hypothetical protein G6F50_014638 [Rhizopus delemar]|uniref:Uncharacterized protein n=1 Tax=Rhizopus delemar TaxID=936053 RepID=A0A9P6Y3M0_9FUNG|nr:hypothetical protein G6F50_014638 [Rhizopus delemar]